MADSLGRKEVRRALTEDHADNDVTTGLLGKSAGQPAEARFIAEARFVVAGLFLVELVYKDLEPGATVTLAVKDGAWVEAGATLATAHGSAGALLSGERVALNFLQRLSGTATLTRVAVDAVRGTGTRITHTRKTTPGLRELERYAVRLGGGVDNRGSLEDAVLWKDNHWAMLKAKGETLAQALKRVPPGVPVMIEVETDEQLDQALAAKVTHVLLDNRTPDEIRTWCKKIPKGVTIQASGGIRAENARAYAEAGATLISIGALTHSAPAVSISCEITREAGSGKQEA